MDKNALAAINPEWDKDAGEIREALVKTAPDLSGLSTYAVAILFVRFCNIQAANWLMLGEDMQEIGRFVDWLRSGNDDDAWS